MHVVKLHHIMSAYDKIKPGKCVTGLENILIVDLLLKQNGAEVGEIWSQLSIIFFNCLPSYVYGRQFSIQSVSPLLLCLWFILYI